MTQAGLIRLAVIAAAVALLEPAWRTGFIGPRVMVSPSEMAVALVGILASGAINGDIARTLGVVAAAVALSITLGFALGLLVHALPRLRDALDPFFATYYAVPIFI